ncbi:hypothetical protein [Escherichia phage EP_H11]|nr:hypothetical protein [Escherichia phage EP_H11]
MKALTLILRLITLLVSAMQVRFREKKDEEIKNDPTGAWESKFGKLQQPTNADADPEDKMRPSTDSSDSGKRRDQDS